MDYLKNSTKLEETFKQLDLTSSQNSDAKRKIGPVVPPKPLKNQPQPEIPQSCYIGQTCKPLYSQRLQFPDATRRNTENSSSTDIIENNLVDTFQPLLQRKKLLFGSKNEFGNDVGKVTLDNPAILEQQLEVLAHHKKQLERKGLLPKSSLNNVPKLSSTSLASSSSDLIYANIQSDEANKKHSEQFTKENDKTYSNINSQRSYFENIQAAQGDSVKSQNKIYSNVFYEKKEPHGFADDCLHPTYQQTPLAIVMPDIFPCSENLAENMQAPPSPVSSSYSELRRANEIYSEKKNHNSFEEPTLNESNCLNSQVYGDIHNYMNIKYKNDYRNQDSTDYYGIGSFSQTSSTYESIYEPINPRPTSQLSSRSNFLNYSPYANAQNAQLSNSSSLNILSLNGLETSPDNVSVYSNGGRNRKEHSVSPVKSENEVETLTNFLVHSMDRGNDLDNYGICFKCNERVVGENSGCTAMNQVYHITCFTCSQCQINLQGKPFYAIDGKPFCEYDYLQTLEKCSVCMKPILERILRATGKPYHPQCFTCTVCGKSLDGIPFTVDATNKNYCIEDFHKKFAPRCCVCKDPIMPEPGEEETVRVVALDRSFHFECYKCEDCGLLLSSEAEGRGCYPLDDHVLCKSCNAKRVQLLTNCITTEI